MRLRAKEDLQTFCDILGLDNLDWDDPDSGVMPPGTTSTDDNIIYQGDKTNQVKFSSGGFQWVIDHLIEKNFLIKFTHSRLGEVNCYLVLPEIDQRDPMAYAVGKGQKSALLYAVVGLKNSTQYIEHASKSKSKGKKK